MRAYVDKFIIKRTTNHSKTKKHRNENGQLNYLFVKSFLKFFMVLLQIKVSCDLQ